MNPLDDPQDFATAPADRAALGFSPYREFSRDAWAKLRADTPMTLVPRDLEQLSGLIEELSIAEVEEIYLPMSRLLNLHVAAAQELHAVTNRFLGRKDRRVPYIRKGFPESFDVARLLNFLNEVKSGQRNVAAPVYSHFHYDIIPGHTLTIDRPDILIVEGLNVLQPARLPRDGEAIPFVSDFFNFSIYMDAEPQMIETWYVTRFMRLRQTAFRDPAAYFHRYALLSPDEARAKALEIWRTVNEKNLVENILPTRPRARLILRKSANHRIDSVALRRI
jgi:type I pantothenate kinase